MVNITRKAGRLLNQKTRSGMEMALVWHPRKRPKPMKTCLNPEASVAGFIVSGCICMICNHRREKS
jgi:hypothetical protein